MSGVWLIERTDQGGGFVSPPGSVKSYQRDPVTARRFDTAEAAEAERCIENERTVRLRDVLARVTSSD